MRIFDRRKRRSSGTHVVLADAESADLSPDDGPYVTICEEHAGVVHHPTLTAARTFAPHPKDWCPVCQGHEPVPEIAKWVCEQCKAPLPDGEDPVVEECSCGGSYVVARGLEGAPSKPVSVLSEESP